MPSCRQHNAKRRTSIRTSTRNHTTRNHTTRKHTTRKQWGAGHTDTAAVDMTHEDTDTYDRMVDEGSGRNRGNTVVSRKEFDAIIDKERAYAKRTGITDRNDWEGAALPPSTHQPEIDLPPAIESAIDDELFNESVNALRSDGNYYPDSCKVQEVLDHALTYFKTNHNHTSILSHINVPTGGKLHVIGDIHGNKTALFQYLDSIGTLSETNQLLFLGDIIDRGEDEWHCMLLVLLYQMRYPGFCTILRGNHEDASLSAVYGMFSRINKLKASHAAIKAMSEIFPFLKLCCIVKKNQKETTDAFFCVHGGPPVANKWTTKQLEEIKLPVNVDDLPHNWAVEELLWNDPRRISADFVESRRGKGFQFSKECRDNWMTNNKITRILRAHECPADKGCAVTDLFGDGKCLTVFSAPNYYPPSINDPGSRNQGGYLMVSNIEGESDLVLTHIVTGNGICNNSPTSGGIQSEPLPLPNTRASDSKGSKIIIDSFKKFVRAYSV